MNCFRTLNKKTGIKSKEGVDNVDKSPSTHTLWRSAYSKYLKYLALLAALSVIVATLVDFQFKTIAEGSFSSSDALTSFFGSFYALTGLVALLVQLLFSQRIWRRMGIGASLLLMPFSIAIGALALLIYPSLWSVIIMKGGEGSFKHSLNRSGMELLFLPVPSDLKGRAKSLIDMSIDRLARGFAGVLLLFLTSLLALKIQHLNLLILGLSAIWLWFIFLSKREYVNFLRHTLAESNETAAERFGAIPTCPHLCDNDNRLRLIILEEEEINMLGFPASVGLVHDIHGHIEIEGEPYLSLWEYFYTISRSFLSIEREYGTRLLQGERPEWHCRAGSRYLYVDEYGKAQFCSAQRGRLNKDITAYTSADLRHYGRLKKGCESGCTLSCTYRCSAIDNDPGTVFKTWLQNARHFSHQWQRK